MAKRMTDKELAKWRAKGVALAQKWIDDGYDFETVGQGMVNRGFCYEIKNGTLFLCSWRPDRSMRSDLLATFTK